MDKAGKIISAYCPPVLANLALADTSIVSLGKGEGYADHSALLSSLQIDRWPNPPAGLFVIAERSIYLRTVSPMTVIHELGHALDCALGNGEYVSHNTPFIQGCFNNANAFVTPYAATGLDEFFAECFRAYCEANDPMCAWKPVNKAMLWSLHPRMFALFRTLESGSIP